MKARTLLAPISVALSLILVPTAAAAQTHDDHGNRSQLVWSRAVDSNGTVQLVISDPLGRGERELTRPAAGVRDVGASISPDGRLVAFERDFPDGNAVIRTVGTDGRGEREVPIPCTDPCADPLKPGWTPDGRHLIFTLVIGPFDLVNDSARSAVLWTTDLDGKQLTRVSEPGIDGALEDYNASFAPDGYIVFTRVRNTDVTPAAFRMNPDGTHVRQLTLWEVHADGAQVSPAPSGPTHNTVVFETARDGAVSASGVLAGVGHWALLSARGRSSLRISGPISNGRESRQGQTVGVHETLRAAMAPVLADLRASGGPLPLIVDDEWINDPDYASAMLGGTGISVRLADAESKRVASVADQVQEWAIEEL